MSAQILHLPERQLPPRLVNDVALWAHLQQPMEPTVKRRKLDNCVGLLASNQPDNRAHVAAKLRAALAAAPVAELLPFAHPEAVTPLRTIAAEWRYFTSLAEWLSAPRVARPRYLTREEANALGDRRVSPRTAARYARDIAEALRIIEGRPEELAILQSGLRAIAAVEAHARMREESIAAERNTEPKGAA